MQTNAQAVGTGIVTRCSSATFACTLLQPIVWTALGRTRRMKDEDEDDHQDEVQHEEEHESVEHIQ